MNEQPQWLARSAGRPGVRPQIVILARPFMALGELSANLGEPGGDAAHQDPAGRGDLPAGIPAAGGHERSRRRTTRQVIAKPLPGPRRCKEITPKTTESHWSGGQREP
jgi:hypothetical protein